MARALTVVLGTMFMLGMALPDAAAQVPWASVEEAVEHYLVVENRQADRDARFAVWRADASEPSARLSQAPLRLVPGRTDLLVAGSEAPDGRIAGRFGMTQGTRLLRIGGEFPFIQMTLETCPICGEDEIGIGSPRYPGPYLSRDLARVIFFVDGDLWVGRVDWGAGAVVDRRQVTQVGLFDLEHSEILHWYGDIVLLEAGFSEERPIVRVELGAGDVQEIPPDNVFGPDMFATRSGRHLCSSMTELLACYEVAEGRRFRISLLPVLEEIRGPRDLRFVGKLFEAPARDLDYGRNVRWLDGDLAVSWTSSVLAVVDFDAGSARPVLAPERPQGGFGSDARLLPGREHLMIPLGTVTPTGPEAGVHRIDLEDGSLIGLTELPRVTGAGLPDLFWVDARRYVFARTEGGLSEIGTWLHDVETGESLRLCPSPAQIGGTSMRIVVGPVFSPGQYVIHFHTGAQGGAIFRASLDGAECSRIADGTAVHPIIAVAPELVSDVAIASIPR